MERKWSSNGVQMELKWSSNGSQMELKWSSNAAESPVELKWRSNRAQMEVKCRRGLVLNDPGGLMGRGCFMTPERCRRGVRKRGRAAPAVKWIGNLAQMEAELMVEGHVMKERHEMSECNVI